VINTCDEQGAGFAADAYARVAWAGGGVRYVLCRRLEGGQHHGGAFAEKSPVVVISGGRE